VIRPPSGELGERACALRAVEGITSMHALPDASVVDRRLCSLRARLRRHPLRTLATRSLGGRSFAQMHRGLLESLGCDIGPVRPHHRASICGEFPRLSRVFECFDDQTFQARKGVNRPFGKVVEPRDAWQKAADLRDRSAPRPGGAGFIRHCWTNCRPTSERGDWE
jgi:hypothetical protein